MGTRYRPSGTDAFVGAGPNVSELYENRFRGGSHNRNGKLSVYGPSDRSGVHRKHEEGEQK